MSKYLLNHLGNNENITSERNSNFNQTERTIKIEPQPYKSAKGRVTVIENQVVLLPNVAAFEYTDIEDTLHATLPFQIIENLLGEDCCCTIF